MLTVNALLCKLPPLDAVQQYVVRSFVLRFVFKHNISITLTQKQVKVLYIVRNTFMISCFEFSFERWLFLWRNLYEY